SRKVRRSNTCRSQPQRSPQPHRPPAAARSSRKRPLERPPHRGRERAVRPSPFLEPQQGGIPALLGFKARFPLPFATPSLSVAHLGILLAFRHGQAHTVGHLHGTFPVSFSEEVLPCPAPDPHKAAVCPPWRPWKPATCRASCPQSVTLSAIWTL